MKYYSLLLVTLVCLAFVGCERSTQANNGPVAVVDLDAVAKRLGKDKQILQMIEQRQVSLNEQLAATQNSLIQQLNQKKSEFGELNDDETNQLAQLQNQANSILLTSKTQAQSNLTMYQQEVVNRFRAETKPIAMELAAKKGCRVVLSKNDSVVFAFDATVDLTDDLVAHLQQHAASAKDTTTPVIGAPSPTKQASTGQSGTPKR